MITVDVKNWRMRDFIAFQETVSTGDFSKVFEALSHVVTTWDYEGDPTKPESYLNLTVPEFRLVQKQVGEALKDSFSE